MASVRSNWVDPSIKTSSTGMNRDPPLAAYGTQQANQVADFLSDETALAPYPIPERVFSSPFYRCIETSIPAYQALSKRPGGCGSGVMLEHGAQEWYSTVYPDTGLHPRPSDPSRLAPLFPPNTVDTSYTSTLFPSRRGETLSELHDRADILVEAWTARVEETGVKCVVLFAHAASVIAIGRALTGDKDFEVTAGCATTSLYKRRNLGVSSRTSQPASQDELTTSRSTSSLNAANSLLEMSGSPQAPLSRLPTSTNEVDGVKTSEPCGVGEWENVYTGRSDYLSNGLERDWSFRDIVIVDGEVIKDNGDKIPHPPEDAIPTGLAAGMERYLRRGLPPKNGQIKEIIIANQKTARM